MSFDNVASVAYAYTRVQETIDITDALPEQSKRQKEKKSNDLERLYHAEHTLRTIKQDVEASTGCYVTLLITSGTALPELKVRYEVLGTVVGVFPISTEFLQSTLDRLVMLVLEKHKELELLEQSWKRDMKLRALVDTVAVLRMLFDPERRL
jgi:hypothetical protein